MLAGVISLFVYLLPVNEGLAGALSVIIFIWQGILLWKVKPEKTHISEITNQPDRG
jgi:hypothetical protein